MSNTAERIDEEIPESDVDDCIDCGSTSRADDMGPCDACGNALCRPCESDGEDDFGNVTCLGCRSKW